MAKVEGLERVISALKGKAKGAKRVSVIVGFTQAYAIYVHENLEAKHPVGQAKYLEQPARTHSAVLAGIVKEALRHGKTLVQALLLAGLRLQREAQLLTPVDTGALRASAFTRVDNG